MINLIFPIITFFDEWLAAWIPGLLRICIWGTICGAISMALYYALSNQTAIGQLKLEARKLRQRTVDPDLQYSEFLRLGRRNLIISLHLLGKTGGPALLSILLIGVVVCWLSVYQNYTLNPDNTPIDVEILPTAKGVTLAPVESFIRTDRKIRLIAWDSCLMVRFIRGGEIAYGGSPGSPPSRNIRKKAWWNLLLASEVGYIDSHSSLEEIRFHFPRKVFIHGVPKWMATWELPFFLCLAIVTLSTKLVFRIN